MGGGEVVRMRLGGDIDGLCRMVRSRDRVLARQAIQMLADLGDQRASDVLLRCVQRKAFDRQWLWLAAVDALGRLRERRAVPALIGLLKSGELENPGQEETVLRALGSIGGPEAVHVLLDTLGKGSPRGVVLQALANLRDPVTVPALLVALWGLLPLRGTEAVGVLGELRDPRTAPALLYLVDSDGSPPALRRAALEALTMLPDDSAWPVPPNMTTMLLRNALRDPDVGMARMAAALLTRTHEGRRALHFALLAHRPYEEEPARIAVCSVIRDVPQLFGAGDAAALARLVTGASLPAERRAAAHALVAVGSDEAAAVLLEALADGHVTETVAKVIAELPSPPIERLSMLLAGPPSGPQRLGATIALGLIGHEPAAPLLLPSLTYAAPLVLRCAAIDALGALRHRPATDHLTALARDDAEPARLRARAVRALGLIAAPESQPVLLAALHDDTSEAVRPRAAEALGAYPTREVADRLGELAMADGCDEAAQAALRALGRMGAVAVPTLNAMAHHLSARPHSGLLRPLAEAIASRPDRRLIPALARLSASDIPRHISVTAAEALADRRLPECVPHLALLLADDKSYWCHPIALRALACIGGQQATDAIVAYYEDTSTHREEVREALTALAAIRRGGHRAPPTRR
ncbi:HEAT repeat domain-containing protein [Streptomyces sp. NPDC003442]